MHRCKGLIACEIVTRTELLRVGRAMCRPSLRRHEATADSNTDADQSGGWTKDWRMAKSGKGLSSQRDFMAAKVCRSGRRGKFRVRA